MRIANGRAGFIFAFLFAVTSCRPNSQAAVLAPLSDIFTIDQDLQAGEPEYVIFADKLTATVFERLRRDTRFKIVPNGTSLVCPSKTAVGPQGYLLRANVIQMKGDSAVARVEQMCASYRPRPGELTLGGNPTWVMEFLLVRRGRTWRVDKPMGANIMVDRVFGR